MAPLSLNWAFIYFAHSWAASGRTVGMALFGVRVVRDDGTDVSGRRALHDVIAGTTVYCSWDARAARLRFLSRD